MSKDLEFPRTIYKGDDWNGVPDEKHQHGRAESQDDFDKKAAQGWRLTPDVPADKSAKDKSAKDKA